MLNTFLCITNFLFPLHPTIKAIKNETKDSFLNFYHLRQVNNFITLADYQEKIVKETLKANKFHNYKPASILLATLLENWLKDQRAEKIIFIPVPLGEKRQKERGFNQVTRILKNIKSSEKNFSITPLLKRSRETFPQTKLHRTERLKNIKGAFSINEEKLESELKRNAQEKVSDCLWVVIDDVFTTGATLTEAYKVLKKSLPKDEKVVCLALAH